MTCLQSESLKELAGALAKAQSKMESAGIKSNNPFYKTKYASFASIVKASRPALTENGLAITQRVIFEAEVSVLITMLLHTSGEYLCSTIKIKPIKEDPQSFGSYLSYIKRYAYAAIAGVICEDEDDDAEEAMVPHRDHREEGRGNNKSPNQDDPISKDQRDSLIRRLKGCSEDVMRTVYDSLGINDISEIRRRDFARVENHIDKHKKINGTE
jgi:hypothetical protein